MIRRINYTGRKRIRQKDIRITTSENNGSIHFNADLSRIRDYGLPPDAKVAVEAYRRMTWKRFEFGTVAAITPPEDRDLSAFEVPEAILFRVKVTASENKHLLLAEADRVHLVQPPGRIPLLSVQPVELGDEIFRINFDDSPLLLVNKEFYEGGCLVRHPSFVAMVYPTALREILVRILIVEQHDDFEDPDDWRSQWLRFAISLNCCNNLSTVSQEDHDACWEWIETTVAKFTKQINAKKQFAEFWRKESEA